ncbi:hypothetical protein PIB30_117917 [Stylosanthes scabra]|uniref:Uncharacterized protein n=1 Tax=Stylosanthes scabra TaxID=79078 RepID=A0ABU6QHH4_9FABA|nr:hypothetical protein [Stylosanthes scabra]
MHWVSWQLTCCRPKEQGGLNFKDLKAFLLAMLAKQGWRLLTRLHSLVYKVYCSKYFRNSTFLQVELGHKSQPILGWRSILEGRKVLEKGLLWKLGNGLSVRIKKDSWVKDYVALSPTHVPGTTYTPHLCFRVNSA